MTGEGPSVIAYSGHEERGPERFIERDWGRSVTMNHGNKTSGTTAGSAKARSGLSVAIACALLAPAAWAQDVSSQTEASADATTLTSVTVTARKREETLQEVPVAVTAFTAQALDKLNVEDLSD